jgi:hypothetical protein
MYRLLFILGVAVWLSGVFALFLASAIGITASGDPRPFSYGMIAVGILIFTMGFAAKPRSGLS